MNFNLPWIESTVKPKVLNVIKFTHLWQFCKRDFGTFFHVLISKKTSRTFTLINKWLQLQNLKTSPVLSTESNWNILSQFKVSWWPWTFKLHSELFQLSQTAKQRSQHPFSQYSTRKTNRFTYARWGTSRFKTRGCGSRPSLFCFSAHNRRSLFSCSLNCHWCGRN